MRPILFNKNETAFDTYGLGELNVTKGTVTRERNGNYTLYSEISANDPMVATLEKEMKLKADAGLRTKSQTFEISRIVKDSSNIVKIYGQHISHKLEYMGLVNGRVFSGSAFTALAIWHNATIGDLRFDVWSDIQTTGKGVFDISKMENARQALGGVEGSILDIYGGEYEFDNMTVRLHKQLGRTAPTVLEYGRNILSAELDETIESAYTSVLPFATYTPDKPEGDTSDSQPDPVTVTLPENYVDSKYKALYAHRRIKVVDFSSEFKSDSKSKDIPTPDKLRKIANDYMERNEIGKPKINIKIEYADLARTLDYADRGWIEEVELCDIVPVYYPQIGLTDGTLKITTITYDFVNERNESVEFGDIGTNVRATMQSGLAGRVDDIAKAQQDFENSLPDYLLNAQGNKVWYNRPDDKEHKIGDIWFEKNGLYDRMYVWNGSQWEKRIDTEDVDKIKKEVDKQLEQAKQSTAIEIEKANAKAQEALIKAGTIPDTATLSDQIKTLILNSPDLSRKVTETFNNADNGDTIYSKVYSKVAKNFATIGQFDTLDRVQNDQGRDLLNLSKKIETQTVEFNKLTESNKLYERILGTSETGAPDKLSRLVMSSDIFQTEVGKYVTDDNNLIVNSMTMATNTLVGNNNPNASVSVSDGVFTIKAQGLTSYNWTGFSLPIYVKKVYHGETYTLGFKYRIREYPDVSFAFNIKNHGLNKTLTWANIGENRPPLNEWQEFQKTFTMQEDFAFGEDKNYPFYIFLAKNGWIEFKEPILVRGSNTGPYKPSQFDDAYKTANKTRELAEATRTQVTQLAGSYSIQNLNSAGDLISGVNLGADGTNRFVGKLTHITGETQIDNAVIKSAMVDKLKTGNFESESVTTQILASNAVTADKLLVDSAMINKLVTNQAFIRELIAQKAFITQLASVDFSAERIKGGRLESNTRALVFDLDNSAMNMLTDTAVIRRVFNNFPTQFIRYGTHIENGNRFSKTIIGSNRDGTENSGNRTFSGIEIYNSTNEDVEDYTKFYADKLYLQHSEYKQGWIIQNAGKPRIAPLNGTTYSEIIASDFRMIYTADGNHRSVGTYLWDLLTCFGILQKYGWDLKNSAAQRHIGSVLSKYNYR